MSTAPQVPANTAAVETVAGPNILLMGPAGTGKTRSLCTLADLGVEVFVLFLENGSETLTKYYAEKKKKVPANLHWHTIGGAKKTFKDLGDAAQKILTVDQKTLANMIDPKRMQHNLFNKVIECCANFVDDRTGEAFGPVDEWPRDRAFAMDGLTGLGSAAMSMVTGGKPMWSQPDWGIAQGQTEVFLRMCCDQCPCWFILIAHVERETDMVSGGVKLMPSSLGRALPPKIAPMFSDVILTVREGTNWSWDTINSQADVKARNLPWAKDQKPDFKIIRDTWLANIAASEETAG